LAGQTGDNFTLMSAHEIVHSLSNCTNASDLEQPYGPVFAV